MLITKAIFERNLSDFDTQNCVIEGIELMNGDEFEEFSNNLLEDRDFITDRVEGLFDCLYLDNNCILVCNGEGKINGMELNRRVGNDIIAGPFFIVGDS